MVKQSRARSGNRQQFGTGGIHPASVANIKITITNMEMVWARSTVTDGSAL
jgi:hypothetical protein